MSNRVKKKTAKPLQPQGSPDVDPTTEAEVMAAALNSIINDGEQIPVEETSPPPEVFLSTRYLFDVPTEDGKGVETFAFDWSELCPPQHTRASHLLFYENDLLTQPLKSHNENKLSGFYDIEQEVFECLLLKQLPDGSLDRWHPSRKQEQMQAAKLALYRMDTEHAKTLRIIKKNLQRQYGILSTESTRRLRNIVAGLAGFAEAFKTMNVTDQSSSERSKGKGGAQRGNSK